MQGSSQITEYEKSLSTNKLYDQNDKVRQIYYLIKSNPLRIPLYISRIRAGFPSPADDFIEEQIDLNRHLIKKPAATFMVKVAGDSMVKVGIFSNDLLIVDRSIQASHDKIVIAAVDGELTVKRLYQREGIVKLLPENDSYLPIEIKGELEIWGVVRHVIHSFEID